MGRSAIGPGYPVGVSTELAEENILGLGRSQGRASILPALILDPRAMPSHRRVPGGGGGLGGRRRCGLSCDGDRRLIHTPILPTRLHILWHRRGARRLIGGGGAALHRSGFKIQCLLVLDTEESISAPAKMGIRDPRKSKGSAT